MATQFELRRAPRKSHFLRLRITEANWQHVRQVARERNTSITALVEYAMIQVGLLPEGKAR